jgi:hypothetical protein
MAKTAMASKYRGRGIDWLRGDERHEKRRLVTAVSTQGATVRPRSAAGRRNYELSGSGGLTA